MSITLVFIFTNLQSLNNLIILFNRYLDDSDEETKVH